MVDLAETVFNIVHYMSPVGCNINVHKNWKLPVMHCYHMYWDGYLLKITTNLQMVLTDPLVHELSIKLLHSHFIVWHFDYSARIFS